MCFRYFFFNLNFEHNILDDAQKSVSWAKYPYVAIKYALKSCNAPKLASAPVFWRVKNQTSAKTGFKKNKDHKFVLETSDGSYRKHIGNIFQEKFKKMLSCQIQKRWAFRWEKGLGTLVVLASCLLNGGWGRGGVWSKGWANLFEDLSGKLF